MESTLISVLGNRDVVDLIYRLLHQYHVERLNSEYTNRASLETSINAGYALVVRSKRYPGEFYFNYVSGRRKICNVRTGPTELFVEWW